MDFANFDIATRKKLQEAHQLLSYKPNNPKMLKMHQSDSKVRLVLGGKRSGKTTFGVVETIWAGLGIHPYLPYPDPPLNIRVCSVDFVAGVKGIILPMYYQWLPRGSIKKFWAEDRILELTNGTQYDFKSYDQDVEKYEGVGRHLIWMDEEPLKALYQSNYMRTIAAGLNMGELGGKLMITCTPLHGMTWLYDDLYDNPEAIPPYVEHCHVRIYDNPHLSKAAIDAALKDPAMQDNLDAAIEGRFISRSGLIYKQFSEKNVLAPIRSVPPDWLVVLGIDPHDRNPHGVVFMGLTPENVWIVFDEILEQCILSDLVGKIRFRLGTRWPPNLAIIDTSASTPQSIAGRSVADELTQKYGLYVVPAHKDIQAGRLKVSQLLEPGHGMLPKLYVTENCRHTIREFRHYIWDDWARYKDKQNPKERPLKKDDHLLDALRYVTMANIVYRHPGLTRKATPPNTPNRTTGYF
jgi:phage terminase large subunit-like protein